MAVFRRPLKLRLRGRGGRICRPRPVLMVAIYPEKERKQRATRHQQLERSVRANGASAGDDLCE